jgi:hypothetical protein
VELGRNKPGFGQSGVSTILKLENVRHEPVTRKNFTVS